MSNETVVAEIEAKNTVTIGDKVYNVDDITPTEYFEYLKHMKKDIEDENLQTVADNCLTLLKKTKITGQTSAAKKIFDQYSLIMRELKAASFGFNTILYKSNLQIKLFILLITLTYIISKLNTSYKILKIL